MKIMTIPNWEIFKKYLIEERHINPRSFIKSAHKYILEYFNDKAFNKKNFKIMLNELRKGTKNKIPLNTNTINKYIQVGKHIDNFMNTRELYDLKQYPVLMSNKEKIIMTDEQMEAIANCDLEQNKYRRKSFIEEDNLKYKTMFQVLRFSGMRTSELLKLKWTDYKGDYFELFATKTKEKRIIPIPSFVCKMINKLKNNNSEYIFSSRQTNLQIKMETLNNELHRRTKLLGLSDKITVYNFRYTFDTLCALGGDNKSLSQIAKITGHSIETAQKYYLQYSVRDLRTALENTHPGLKKENPHTDIKSQVIAKISQITDESKLQAILCLL